MGSELTPKMCREPVYPAGIFGWVRAESPLTEEETSVAAAVQSTIDKVDTKELVFVCALRGPQC